MTGSGETIGADRMVSDEKFNELAGGLPTLSSPTTLGAVERTQLETASEAEGVRNRIYKALEGLGANLKLLEAQPLATGQPREDTGGDPLVARMSQHIGRIQMTVSDLDRLATALEDVIGGPPATRHATPPRAV